MLTKPGGCVGCPLHQIGEGFMRPSLAGKDRYGVALVGEALGADEAAIGSPFVGAAGHQLTRLIQLAGLDRAQFDIFNTVWCRPPDNRLEGTDYESGAVRHCRDHHWGSLLSQARVVVPMGNVPLNAFIGRKGILTARGYVYAGTGFHILPTVHPSYIRRGASRYAAAFIHDLQRAVEIARSGLPMLRKEFTLDPLPGDAVRWVEEWERAGRPLLAFDIETPGKSNDEEDVSPEDDPTYQIDRIGFAYKSNHAMSIPWSPLYMGAIRRLLESHSPKVAHNVGFDVPRIRFNGVSVNGLVHDSMVAWHVLHSDLPKGLAFVATFCCPAQPPWKHLSGSSPAYYNATDADVTITAMEEITRELHRLNLWRVYEEEVLNLDPILAFMSEQGMPVDAEVRRDRAERLAAARGEVLSRMVRHIPASIRRVEPKGGFVKDPPGAVEGDVYTRVEVSTLVKKCRRCGEVNPKKKHFQVYKKKVNPCGGLSTVTSVEQISRWARLTPFTPSREQLIRYNTYHGRPTPLRRDKKSGERRPTMDEKAIKEMLRKFPDDPVYQGVLEYREIDKIAGTYIGRPGE